MHPLTVLHPKLWNENANMGVQNNCCFPSNSSCAPYFVLFIVMPCSFQNFINYNRAFRRRFCLFCCSGRTDDLLPLL